MGQLPKHRVTANHPFYATGVDYAGPVLIRDKRGRGSQIIKACISLFVCLSTNAIHLEPVTDLTTESFLSVLHRFCARRGKPTVMYSDNGTNFVGTNSELSQLKTFFENSEYSIVQSLATEGIDWKFIPPNAPHFGGLWEAGVKSTKFHIRRVLANVSITFEELLTVLTQVEGILNSRPIFPMSSDPNDLNTLTPGHFLIGRPITFLPQPNLLGVKENTLSRYQRLQQMTQHFWTRWSREYISELQQKTKWKSNLGSINVGDLVVIKDDHLLSSRWKLGRITEVQPGKDNVVRVVTIRTSSGQMKRSVTRVCPLPVLNED
ncbi:hypothetical protein Trydic_g9215 [Trypoxylus dichotomus]